MAGLVLTLDLATKFGWCEGEPGKKPVFGSERFAPEGSGSSAVFGGAIKWVATRCQAFRPRTIVMEAPLDPRHLGPKTTRDTAMRLIGLPACVEGTAYLSGVYDVREARADDVRLFLTGRRLKKAEAKIEVIARLQALGFEVNDPDAADALALWLFSCHQIAPDVEPICGRIDAHPAIAHKLKHERGKASPKIGKGGTWEKGLPEGGF